MTGHQPLYLLSYCCHSSIHTCWAYISDSQQRGWTQQQANSEWQLNCIYLWMPNSIMSVTGHWLSNSDLHVKWGSLPWNRVTCVCPVSSQWTSYNECVYIWWRRYTTQNESAINQIVLWLVGVIRLIEDINSLDTWSIYKQLNKILTNTSLLIIETLNSN